jgi:hypothetical protein
MTTSPASGTRRLFGRKPARRSAFAIAIAAAAAGLLATPALAAGSPAAPARAATISATVAHPASRTPGVTCPQITGKVWAVSPAQAANAAFPAPAATPDLTFCTSGIAYIGQWDGLAGTQPQHCFTIATFLNSCGTAGTNFQYSNLPNPNLGGGVMNGATPMAGAGYGIMIEFTGTVNLTNGELVRILHDDGVSLNLPCVPNTYNPHTTAPVLESSTATCTGTEPFDLLYANVAGAGAQGAWLEFFPQLF